MAKGANGTIDLESFEQVNQQRKALEARNLSNGLEKNFGIASNRLSNMFSSSPLLATNRTSGTSDRGGLYEGGNDIYDAFASQVDKETVADGFGFEGTEVAHLNYTHKDNPFYNASDKTVDYKKLTTGQKATEADNESTINRYQGFPALQIVGTLSKPQEDSSADPSEDLQREPNNNFGSTPEKVREQLNILYSGQGDDRGVYESDGTSEADTLGKYFTKDIKIV
tara:strand:- start:281 stop:955 length:675 start_codon:yes stop_codon:yes gene_type:complete